MSASRPEVRPLRLDLHLHTDRSDGRHSPEEVLRRCAAGGIDVVALTDHDVPPAIPCGPRTVAGRTLRVVHAVELSGQHEGREQHLLAYFPAEIPGDFAAWCRGRARARAERHAEALRRLGLPGLDGPDEQALCGERGLTRLHLARNLVSAGHVPNLEQAFRRYVGDRSPSIPPLDTPFLDVLAAARDAGAFTSWAHPGLPEARAWTKVFGRGGLHALEVHRPALGRSLRDAFQRLAFQHGLAVTGGSDWHGWWPGEVGAFSFPLRQAGPFAAAMGIEA